MGRSGRFDIRGLKELQEELNKLQDPDKFVEACAKELAARLLRMVVKGTPVGDYSGDSYTCASGEQHKGHKVSGKTGGTLRRGWTGSKRSSAQGYADSLTIHHFGDTYVIEIVNPVEYASYVEYGHRTINNGWVPGRLMMTTSEQELERIAPKVLERKIKKYLKGCMK